MIRKLLSFLGLALLGSPLLQAQACDPSTAPGGLSATYTPGYGALLQWTAVPSSVGVQIRATTPSGASIKRRLLDAEPDLYLVDYTLLEPGTYTWRIQAACGTGSWAELTPVSAEASFTVGGSVTCPATVMDVDGNLYNTVEIGGQCWMAENLATETYRDGTPASAWSYNDSPTNKAIYGMLYDWYTATDPRGLCPAGWHVPTDGEWAELTVHLGGISVAGGAMKTTGTLGAGTGLWADPNTGATNSSGFSGLPGGYRNLSGLYTSRGVLGSWWSATESGTGVAKRLAVNNTTADVYPYDLDPKSNGYSVRCVRDE